MRLLEVNATLSTETSIKPNYLASSSGINYRSSANAGESIHLPTHEQTLLFPLSLVMCKTLARELLCEPTQQDRNHCGKKRT